MSSQTIKDISTTRFVVPLRISFNHTSANRSTSSSLITKVTLGDVIGYGEGTPREYVTGESIESAESFVKRIGNQFAARVSDVASLRTFVSDNRVVIDSNPAAFASLEVAFLDALGKKSGKSIEDLLEIHLYEVFLYSAVIGDSVGKKLAAQCLAYRFNKMTDLKLKVSSDLDRERSKASTINKIVRPRSVRIDANNLWESVDEAVNNIAQIAALYPRGLEGVEEPLATRAGSVEMLHSISQTLATPIILDESCTKLSDLDSLSESPNSWIVNVRVSKMGGILRATEVVEKCVELGIPVVVGAHVGETSILTRGALTVASSTGRSLRFQEGGFGRYLLKSGISSPEIRFGRSGVLKSKKYDLRTSPGLGLNISIDL